MIYILHVGVQTQWNEDDVAATNDCSADSCDVSLEYVTVLLVKEMMRILTVMSRWLLVILYDRSQYIIIICEMTCYVSSGMVVNV